MATLVMHAISSFRATSLIHGGSRMSCGGGARTNLLVKEVAFKF